MSKQTVEILAAGFAARGRLTIACLRPALIPFPDQMAEWAHVAAEADGAAPPPGVPPVAQRVLEPLPLTRAYVAPEDAARAFALALDADFGPLCHCYLTAEDTMSTQPTRALVARTFGVDPPVTRPDLFARMEGASPFDLEPARTALGWQPRDRWSGLVARHAVR
jgi:nucleoside-diphosphate-sugar epimerase